MKSLTATQTRQRFGKCIESAHKQIGLRDLRTAGIAARQGNPLAADVCLRQAIFHLTHAEAITARAASK